VAWWDECVRKHGGVDSLKDVDNGAKVVLLLHILGFSQKLGDKVLVFAQCLKTLDFIEKVLALSDWSEHVSSLGGHFKEQKLGGWKKNVDYVRIDGKVNAGERGELVNQFNEAEQGTVRCFLISSVAGGIGINLHSANRVVVRSIE
jgi:transcriptional regulator ATRX